MGILNAAAGKGLTAVGLGGIVNPSTEKPKGFANDFEAGLLITEIVNGQMDYSSPQIQLVGSFMPKNSLDFGGKQRLEKEYYAGNPEPTVQVMGAQEGDVTIEGKFNTKKFKGPLMAQLAKSAVAYQEKVDKMRQRGNMVRISLGEWVRYGFIEEANFKLKRLTEIEYTIQFFIIGATLPKNTLFGVQSSTDISASNNDLTNLAASQLATAKTYPDTMPRTISEFLDDQISAVAGAVKLVTDFIDGALQDVEGVVASANRAIGLIKNARTVISKTKRRVGGIATSVSNLGSSFSSASDQAKASVKNISHIHTTQTSFSSIAALLASLRAKYSFLSESTATRRHLVKFGDTLQKISRRYYGSIESWKKIYDHNKLTTTVLVVGATLEIPEL